jgi:hypothetical protein
MSVAPEAAGEVSSINWSEGVRGTGEDVDLDLSFSSAFSNIDNDDDISTGGGSTNSNASSVHGNITAATNRRRGRIQRIRDSFQRNFNNEGEPPSTIDAVENVEIGLKPSLSQANGQGLDRRSSGIMTVRTLGESLHGADNRITKMRRLRRKVTIQFKGASAEMRGSPSRSDRETATKEDARDAIQENGDESVLMSQSVASTISTLDDITLGFHKVYIRDYEVVPGCNPSVSCGPPLELGWRHSEHREVDFEIYESVRDGKRRSNHQMRMPKNVRKDLLIMHGSTKKMIKDASKQAKKPR